jgi:predicted O-methyltransferase YrrM
MILLYVYIGVLLLLSVATILIGIVAFMPKRKDTKRHADISVHQKSSEHTAVKIQTKTISPNPNLQLAKPPAKSSEHTAAKIQTKTISPNPNLQLAKPPAKSENIKRKIAIVMWYNDAVASYGDLAFALNKEYCEERGYDLIRGTERNLYDRHPSWESFALIIDVLEQDKHDYVVWIDADACFNSECPDRNYLNNLINQYPEVDFILSQDPAYPTHPINMGLYVVKNTPYSTKVLYDMLRDTDPECMMFGDEQLHWEQTCATHYIKNNKHGFADHSVIIPYGSMQVFIWPNKEVKKSKADFSDNWSDPGVLDIDHDAWVYHFSGSGTSYRCKVIKSMINRNNKKPHIPRMLDDLEGDFGHMGLFPREVRALKSLGKDAKTYCEIGFNKGHSASYVMESNPDANIVAFELARNNTTLGALNILNKEYPDRINMIWGDSLETVPSHKPIGCDVFLIDGNHEYEYVSEDIKNIKQHMKPGGIVMVDDVHCSGDWCIGPNKAWTDAVQNGFINEIHAEQSYDGKRGYALGRFPDI